MRVRDGVEETLAVFSPTSCVGLFSAMARRVPTVST